MVHLKHCTKMLGQKPLIKNLSLLLIGGLSLYGETLVIVNPADTHETTFSSYFSSSAFMATDPVTIKNFFGEWGGAYTPRQGTNYAFASARVETGVRRGEWSVGYVHRLETLIEASRDLVDLVHDTKNEMALPVGRTYDLHLRINGFQADGVALQRRFPLYESGDFALQGGFGLSLLRGILMQEGTINGQATTISTKDYNFDAVVNSYYSHNYLYKLDVAKPQGYGASSDIGFNARWRDLTYALAVNDLFGGISWDKNPYTYATLTSSTKSYDAKGYLQYNPTVSGLEVTKKHWQRFDPKIMSQLSYRYDNYEPFIRITTIRGVTLPETGLIYQPTQNMKIRYHYESMFGSHGVSLETKYLQMRFQTDRWDLQKSSAVGAYLGIVIPY